jgi:hypothetical protein
MLTRKQVEDLVSKAIRHYWNSLGVQGKSQGRAKGSADYGRRTEVTGGKQLDGFIDLIVEILVSAGLKRADIFVGRNNSNIPGFYRPTKNWDVVAVAGKDTGRPGLLACVEIKSLGGPSFGNNYNNRVEEALGNSADVWKAYEMKVIPLHPRPFLGYVMLLEDHEGSVCPIKIVSPHFPVDKSFPNTSYEQRMKILCERLIRERVYDATALVMASRQSGGQGKGREPSADLSVYALAAALDAHVNAYLRQRQQK